MFTFKERSDEELLELLKADKFDEFAEELSKSYVNQKLQEPTSQEQQNDDSENAVLMEVDSTGQLLYEESETDNSEKSPEKKTDNRTTTIAFRVSDDELKKIEKRFQQSGFSSKGDFYRFCIMNAFVFKEDDSYLDKISKVISGVGRNINQIAFHINSTHRIYAEDMKNIQKGKVPKIADLEKSLKSLETDYKALVKQLNELENKRDAVFKYHRKIWSYNAQKTNKRQHELSNQKIKQKKKVFGWSNHIGIQIAQNPPM